MPCPRPGHTPNSIYLSLSLSLSFSFFFFLSLFLLIYYSMSLLMSFLPYLVGALRNVRQTCAEGFAPNTSVQTRANLARRMQVRVDSRPRKASCAFGREMSGGHPNRKRYMRILLFETCIANSIHIRYKHPVLALYE